MMCSLQLGERRTYLYDGSTMTAFAFGDEKSTVSFTVTAKFREQEIDTDRNKAKAAPFE